jgi:hypothetical protein
VSERLAESTLKLDEITAPRRGFAFRLYEWLKQQPEIAVPNHVRGFEIQCRWQEPVELRWQALVLETFNPGPESAE